MENGQFEQVFPVQKSGFPPFLRPSSFARTSRLSRGRVGPRNANNERRPTEETAILYSENTCQKTSPQENEKVFQVSLSAVFFGC